MYVFICLFVCNDFFDENIIWEVNGVDFLRVKLFYYLKFGLSK